MSFKDMDLAAKIQGSIAKDAALKASDINVETQNGVVTLKGKVPNANAKQHVAKTRGECHPSGGCQSGGYPYHEGT